MAIKLTSKTDVQVKPRVVLYNDIPRPQVFRGRALNGPHEGTVGIFLKVCAASGGLGIKESILYRLDNHNPLESYVGSPTDFVEYEPLDLELVITKEEK